MFDHVGLNVSDYAASRSFYERALAPLGFSVVMSSDESKSCGLGTEGQPAFFVTEREPSTTGTHVAFTASDRATVDAFHEAALDAGGIDNGRPGVREQYHPTYYAAFVHDLDGNNIEAVCHAPA
ncbi:MAG TPA: VOC family protein [Gaiellaceae bacterium]|jgi:catechol 2,3-dioxygenase-like lactoylglutathione lyase family enzyme